MQDLFGWNSGYIDKYAGLGDYERYKKLVSKANVNMVLNHFTPFNKTKNLKAPTKTVISFDGSDIENTNGPVTFHPKDNKIFVNNASMTERLAKFDVKDRDQVFIDDMKRAYVARSEKDTIKSRFDTAMPDRFIDAMDSKKSDPETKQKTKFLVDIQRQVAVAAQCLVQGVPVQGETSKRGTASDKLPSMDFAQSLFTGEMPKTSFARSMIKKLHDGGKVRKTYNEVMDAFKDQCYKDHASLNFENLSSNDMMMVLEDMVPITSMYGVQPKNDPDKDGKEACSVGNGKMEYNEEPKFSETEKNKDKTYEDSNDVLDYDDIAKTDQDLFFRDNKDRRPDWEKRDASMEVLANALYESLVGKMGRVKSQNPSKRLNTRALTSDISDNIYVSKHQLGGKHLKLNLILDTSGSMSGSYIEDGIDIINCINKLAERGVIDGKLMLSCSGASSMMNLPIDTKLIERISAHNGGEGFKHTFAIRWQEMKDADFNLAITDGQLTDGYIDKEDFLREGISVTGLYVHRGIKENKSQAVKYNGSLSRWFDKSAVRSSAEEAIYFLIDNAILNYDMKAA